MKEIIVEIKNNTKKNKVFLLTLNLFRLFTHFKTFISFSSLLFFLCSLSLLAENKYTKNNREIPRNIRAMLFKEYI
jgi:hypothetical protein